MICLGLAGIKNIDFSKDTEFTHENYVRPMCDLV